MHGILRRAERENNRAEREGETKEAGYRNCAEKLALFAKKRRSRKLCLYHTENSAALSRDPCVCKRVSLEMRRNAIRQRSIYRTIGTLVEIIKICREFINAEPAGELLILVIPLSERMQNICAICCRDFQRCVTCTRGGLEDVFMTRRKHRHRLIELD